MVFKSAQFGNVLVLDGVIQMTERDDFAYHEIMVHVPLFAHENPERVLIVGGGDGGVLREVCKHSCVKEITVVEIDPDVIQVAKAFFHATFDDHRVKLIHTDAAKFLSSHKKSGEYDIILGDTSDPVGPAISLFQPAFYESMYASLRDGGIACVQAESFWIHLELISDLTSCCRDIGFDSAEYATTMVPSYPCGQIGLLLASKGRETCRFPIRTAQTVIENLKWYSPEIHHASFVLPRFVKQRLEHVAQTEDLSGLPIVITEDTTLANNPRNLQYNDNERTVSDSKQTDEQANKCFLDGFLQAFQSLLSSPKLFEYCTKVTADGDDDNDGAYMTDDDDLYPTPQCVDDDDEDREYD